jgi:hypothetical protein
MRVRPSRLAIVSIAPPLSAIAVIWKQCQSLPMALNLRLRCVFSLLLGSTIANLLCATPAVACTGELASLTRFAGGDSGSFLAEPAVGSRISALMGRKVAHLRTNLSVAGPVALIDCELVVQGNARHGGGEQNAILSLDVYSGIMTVAILDRERILVWSTPHRSRSPGDYSHLPAHVRDWIYVAAGGFRSRGQPPPGVIMSPNQRP